MNEGACIHENMRISTDDEKDHFIAHCPGCGYGWCLSKFRLFTIGLIEGGEGQAAKAAESPPGPFGNFRLGHYMLKCSKCGKCLEQCRCADKNKPVYETVCDECKPEGGGESREEPGASLKLESRPACGPNSDPAEGGDNPNRPALDCPTCGISTGVYPLGHVLESKRDNLINNKVCPVCRKYQPALDKSNEYEGGGDVSTAGIVPSEADPPALDCPNCEREHVKVFEYHYTDLKCGNCGYRWREPKVLNKNCPLTKNSIVVEKSKESEK